MFIGSSGSGRGGRLAVLTEQNLQPRVQVSPEKKKCIFYALKTKLFWCENKILMSSKKLFPAAVTSELPCY